VNGANWLHFFRHITLPGIGTDLELLVVLACIFRSSNFVDLDDRGGPSGATENNLIRIYNITFGFGLSYATALGWRALSFHW
jgi:ABC-type sugar transport system permease subunit